MEQAQALRTCSGAFKTSPVAAIQVEMGEQPLRIRRTKIMLTYWVNLQGHYGSHPTKAILEECWEHNKSNYLSFGWVGNAKAESLGLCNIKYSPTVAYPDIPPWLFIDPLVDLNIQQQIKKECKQTNTGRIAERYIEQYYTDKLIVFTDGSKDPETGRTGAAMYIPANKIGIKKRTPDHLSVYTVELIAILIALQWVEENNEGKVVIASDS